MTLELCKLESWNTLKETIEDRDPSCDCVKDVTNFQTFRFMADKYFSNCCHPPTFYTVLPRFLCWNHKYVVGGGNERIRNFDNPNHFLSFFLPPEFWLVSQFFCTATCHLKDLFVLKKKRGSGFAVRRALEQKKMTVPPSYKNVVVLLFHFFNTKEGSECGHFACAPDHQPHSTWCEQVDMEQQKLKC